MDFKSLHYPQTPPNPSSFRKRPSFVFYSEKQMPVMENFLNFLQLCLLFSFLSQRRGIKFLGLMVPLNALDPSTAASLGPSFYLFLLSFSYNIISLVLSFIQRKFKYSHISAILQKRLLSPSTTASSLIYLHLFNK